MYMYSTSLKSIINFEIIINNDALAKLFMMSVSFKLHMLNLSCIGKLKTKDQTWMEMLMKLPKNSREWKAKKII